MKSFFLVVLSCWSAAALAAAPVHPSESITVPAGDAGVGYDDLQYAPRMKRILVPAGRTGRLVLIDPATKKVTAFAGFTSVSSYRGGHGEGTTSAAELDQPGFVVATDRGAKALRVVDTRTGKVGEPMTLAANPDYVRVVSSRNEVWVTEPGGKQIEVLHVDGSPPRLSHLATIPVPDGPESLVIDTARSRAYSHTWKDESYAIGLGTRKIVATWANGCHGSRGMALDSKRGLLFTACAEGKVTVVDSATGKVVSSAATGPGVDSIGYSAALGHLFVPSGGAAELWTYAVAAGGELALLGKVPTARDAHTVAIDSDSGALFVGTPDRGDVLVIRDAFPSAVK